MLSPDVFKTVVENAPLFAIDLVVVNEADELLVGKRLNAPAKNWWFVPGGRVYKNETFDDAFQRISHTELGVYFQLVQAELLGLYEHFYDDSIFGHDISTHYINATHLLRVKMDDLCLPTGEQHLNYRWVSLAEMKSDPLIHHFSKVFLPKLVELIRIS